VHLGQLAASLVRLPKWQYYRLDLPAVWRKQRQRWPAAPIGQFQRGWPSLAAGGNC
jgi:hypothetical protein